MRRSVSRSVNSSGGSTGNSGDYGARWRTSTRSGTNGGQCVEVADNLPGVVAVRNSKDRCGPDPRRVRPQRAVLTFAPDRWQAFVAATRSDQPLRH